MIFDLLGIRVDWLWLGVGMLLGAMLGWRGVTVVAAIGGYILGSRDKKRR